MKLKDILSKELDLIRVSASEISRLERVSSDFIKDLKGAGLKAFVGGSLAKGTLIKKQRFSKLSDNKLTISGCDKQDVDIFVVFDYSEDILKLEGILKSMELPGTLSFVHGSRDYFHVDLGDIMLEVIPVVFNSDPELAENVTDMSLSHVKYICGEVCKNPGIADEIRLAKVFCRANRCYGAEGYVRGFSGYSLEILVIHFGGFVKFLKGIIKNRVIDPLKYFKNEREIMRELNFSKLQGPVVAIDPTYKYRNVCAGLGLATFEKFLEAASDFLKSPSLDAFEMREVDLEGLRKFALLKGARFLNLKLETDRQSGDIAGTKMRKFFEFFIKELVRNGQEVLKSDFDYVGSGQEAFGYLVVFEHDVFERRGPSIGLEEESKKFCESKRDAFRRKGFWWCRENISIDKVFAFVKKFEAEMSVRVLVV